MSKTTRTRPMMPASTLLSSETWPKVGPTPRKSLISSATGKAPERSIMARLRASASDSSPVILPSAPTSPSMVGAEMTAPSRVMTNLPPILARVKSRIKRPPSSSNVIETWGRFRSSSCSRASRRRSPDKNILPSTSLNSSKAVLPIILKTSSWSP